MLNPPLKWAGGKRWQVPHLKPLWEPQSHRRLVEPFCGGLAVSLGLDPERALLNDVNPHLINFYRWVQRGLCLPDKPTLTPMVNDEHVYYNNRAWFNHLIFADEADTRIGAALFYYLNRTGFNGLCRFNKAGQFNVPYGRYKRIIYPPDFAEYQAPFSSWDFTCGDFERLLLQPDDFVCADPPYDGTFSDYSAGGFSWEDQVRLADWLLYHPGPVVLVNQATERIEELYRKLGYTVSFLDAPRRISCTGDRTPAKEVFATRNL